MKQKKTLIYMLILILCWIGNYHSKRFLLQKKRLFYTFILLTYQKMLCAMQLKPL